MFMFLIIFFGFVLGVVCVLALEAAGLAFLIRWFNRKTEKEEKKLSEPPSATHMDPSDFYNKQGFLWILESTEVPKGWPFDKLAKEERPKNEFVEVMPVRKHGKILNHSLVLTDPDGSQTNIPLRGCKIAAVSASGLPSRKWAKRFPVKVEGRESEIYKGCKIVFVYLETSWQKESWCKALRLAACEDKEKLNWASNLSIEFQKYVTSLNTEYPSFIKPSMSSISEDPADRSLRIDGSSSKVRQFLKKITKKALKRDIEAKASSNPMSRSSSSSSVASGNESQLSKIYDKDLDDKSFSDEGVLCWNLLISRLFFDAKNNMQMKDALQSRIQRMLSNMRSPSYIGDIICTSVDNGNVPPHIHGVRVLASNMNEVWAFEIDIEYAGGAVLGVETRLEVGQLDAQEGEELNSSMGQITSELLEGIEFDKLLNVSEDAPSDRELKNGGNSKPDDSKSCKLPSQASSQLSKWKSMLHSVAKQVSQVPIALGIKVTSLRGTMRLYIKPPPSDQIWFGFTSMPEIDFGLESFVGEHKVTSGRLSLFLFSRFKTAIRETLVLPNCESVYIPWMLAEKDDWVPRKVAPFMWIQQDPVADTIAKQEVPADSRLGNVVSEVVNRTNKQDAQGTIPGNVGIRVDGVPSASQDATHDKSVKGGSSSAPTQSESSCANPTRPPQSTAIDHLQDDLSIVLLDNNDSLEKSPSTSSDGMVESAATSRSVRFSDDQSQSMENDDMRPQRLGTRARVLGFRKKMGEKLEEKRRHLEEKGKTIVEKMRESKVND